MRDYTGLEHKVAEKMWNQRIPNVPIQGDWHELSEDTKKPVLNDAREVIELVALEENLSEK